MIKSKELDILSFTMDIDLINSKRMNRFEKKVSTRVLKEYLNFEFYNISNEINYAIKIYKYLGLDSKLKDAIEVLVLNGLYTENPLFVKTLKNIIELSDVNKELIKFDDKDILKFKRHLKFVIEESIRVDLSNSNINYIQNMINNMCNEIEYRFLDNFYDNINIVDDSELKFSLIDLKNKIIIFGNSPANGLYYELYVIDLVKDSKKEINIGKFRNTNTSTKLTIPWYNFKSISGYELNNFDLMFVKYN